MVAEMQDNNLDALELERYRRHLSLPHFGTEGQMRLKQASVLVVGLGGLGSISSLYLTSAGVGKIGLIDDDHVSLDNLPRQILYTTDQIGEPKLALAARRLKAHNPNVEIKTFLQRLNADNAQEIVSEFDLVVDGTDNLATRWVINQTCVAADKPYVYGAVSLYDGQVSVFHASKGPCFACLFPNAPQEPQEKSAEQLAILNTLPAVTAALQTTEAIKLIVGVGRPLLRQLLIYNALYTAFETVVVEKNTACTVCGG
jgi:adenylyltransferase/sulfurtransferase